MATTQIYDGTPIAISGSTPFGFYDNDAQYQSDGPKVANYVARKYGVRSAMPGFIAKKLCPDLIFLPHNFSKYEEVSNQIRQIISEYDPKYRSWSLDEVYFDLKKFIMSANALINYFFF